MKYQPIIQQGIGAKHSIDELQKDYTILDDGMLFKEVNGDDSVLEYIGQHGAYIDRMANALGKGASSMELASMVSTFGRLITGEMEDQIGSQFYEGVLPGGTRNEIFVGDTSVDVLRGTLLSFTANAGTPSHIYMETFKRLLYYPGHEFGTWVTLGSDAIPSIGGSYIHAGLGDQQSGLFLTYKEIETDVYDWGMTVRRSGVDSFVGREDFIDKLDGTGPSRVALNPNNGNIFLLKGGFLGFAPLKLYVMVPDGLLYLVNIIKYPNSQNETHLSNVRLPVSIEISNGDGTETCNVYVGSFSAFTIGKSKEINNRYYIRTRTGTLVQNSTSPLFHDYNPIVAFKPTQTFQGLYQSIPVANYIPAILQEVKWAVSGLNKLGRLTVHLVPASALTVGSWSPVEENGSSLEIANNIDGINSIVVNWTGLTSEKENPIVNELVRTTLDKDSVDVIKYGEYDLQYPMAAVVCLTAETNQDLNTGVTVIWYEAH